jgi:lipoprotein-releasing system permease protein
MDRLIGIWELLSALGGGFSLVVIALLVLAIALLGIVYLGAAAIVLERFARAAGRPLPLLVSALLFSASAAAIQARLEVDQLELASWGEWAGEWLIRLAPIGLACLVAMTLVYLVVRWLDGGKLAVTLGAGVLGFSVIASVAQAIAIARDAYTSTVADLASIAASTCLALIVFGLVPLAVAGFVSTRRSAEWFIATRYLVAERRQVYVSLITLICIGAVASGVWLIVTVLSVMNGFERTWREEIVGNHAHFLVQSYYGNIVGWEDVLADVRSVEGVEAASPYLESEGLIRSQNGGIAPIRLQGVEPVSAARVTRLADKVIEGSLAAVVSPEAEPGDPPGLVIGKVMAEELGASMGDTVVLIAPLGGAKTPLGPAPKLMRFEVVGVFESPFLQYDELYAFTSLEGARAFAGVHGAIGGIAVKSTDLFRSRRVARQVNALLGQPFFSRDWKELFPQFFQALSENRSMMMMLLFMIMVVAAFVIVVTLMMMIMAKSSDIAVLKTIGASDESIERIFAIEGTLIGVTGVVLGVVAGVAVTDQLAWIQARIEEFTGVDTLPASIYQISTLPSEVDALQVVGVCTVALILALGATLLPSRHGARLDPVEGLRHE